MQYLSTNELEKFDDLKINFDETSMISSDTYNESEIFNKFNDINKEDQILLFRAACQIAIIGSGGQSLGKIRDTNGEIVEIEGLFNRLKINHYKSVNEKYGSDDLSMRRLVRLLRKQIMDVILKMKRPSYLWQKYSNKNLDYIGVCFPGGEHILETKEEAEYMVMVYKSLDNKMGNTTFVERIRRVLIARNISDPSTIDDWVKNSSF